MKALLAFAVSIVLTAASFGKDQAVFVLSRVHAEATPETREMVLKHDEESRILHVERHAVISDNDVADATLIEGEPVGILITFTPEGSAKFAKLTKESMHKEVAIILNNQLVSAPIVNSEISGGSFQITRNMTKEFAENVIQAIKSAKESAEK